MANHIRKIEHKKDLYYSLDDIIDLLENVNSIKELKSLLVPDYKSNDDELSDFNKKLVQGLNFNPREDKKNFEMGKYPVVAIFNNRVTIIDNSFPVYSKHHSLISQCISILDKKLEHEESAIIFIEVENGSIFGITTNGKKYPV